MNIFRETESLRLFLHDKRKKHENTSVGLVPTMGALHQGHISLIDRAKKEHTITVCSIYINPIQFNNPEDFNRYPRTEDNDISLLKARGCDVVFIPTHEEMYIESENLRINFGKLEEVMEGKFRPGHFNGVALVVAKLFNIVQPDTAYFGQKDYQQFKIISLLKEVLKFPLLLSRVPTVRESDGLAMSSRNKHLDQVARNKAPFFFHILNFAKKAIKEGMSLHEVHHEVQRQFTEITGVRLEYFEVVHRDTLEPMVDNVTSPDKAMILIAGYVGKVRLIDNMFIGDT